jgi:hypothetical protein
MEQSSSWESKSHLASQKIPRVVYRLRVRYRVHNSPPPVPILILCIQLTSSHHVCLRSTLILSPHLRLDFPRGLFPSSFPINIFYAFFTTPIRAMCPAYLILFDLITLIIFGDSFCSV